MTDSQRSGSTPPDSRSADLQGTEPRTAPSAADSATLLDDGRRTGLGTARISAPLVSDGASANRSAFPQVLVESNHDLPFVTITVGLAVGASLDPAGRSGATRLCARAMRRTAGGRSAVEVDTRVDQLGASFSVEVSHGTTTFGAATISRSVEPFCELLADTLQRPSLAEDELQRLIRETEAELVDTLDNDSAMARRWFRRRLFGDHPYGRSATGTVASLRTLTSEDVRAQHLELSRGTPVIAFAGDIDSAHAERLAAILTEHRSGSVARVADPPDPVLPEGRSLLLVDKPERTQTQILLGTIGTHPWDEDHTALHVANTVLGGTFTARMTQKIRAERGWSYGAYSSLPISRRRQSFSMWAFPKSEDAAPCTELMLQLLEAWWESGIDAKELEWVQSYLCKSHAFSVDTPSKRVHLALEERLYNLPPGYHEQYVDRIRAVTLDEANAAIRRRIDPENLVITVLCTAREVGDAIGKSVPRLGKVEVVPYDAEPG